MTDLQAPNFNHLWATLLIEELVRNGIDTFCVAPGSRSTPLVVAVARHVRARSIVHYDERGAAFHALGYGRATGVPAVVLTTSGSALANVWPAMVEASLERIPLLVLSGDRPPELQDAGANQTMDQVKFFGGYAEWSATLPCPSTRIDPAVVLTTVDQAVSRCRGPSGGAVHINCMFREPLAPTGQGEDFDAYLEPVRAWHDAEHAYTRYESAPARPGPESLAEVAELVARRPRGLLVAGGLADPAARAAVADLAAALGWPLLADVTSGLRLDSTPGTAVPYHDVLLGSKEFMQPHPIEAVIHVGGRLTSRRLMDHLEAVRPSDYVVVDDYPDRQDPIHRATRRFRLPVVEFCEALGAVVGNAEGAGNPVETAAAGRTEGAGGLHWLASWQRASEHVGRRFEEILSEDQNLSEPKVARLVSRHIGAARRVVSGVQHARPRHGYLRLSQIGPGGGGGQPGRQRGGRHHRHGYGIRPGPGKVCHPHGRGRGVSARLELPQAVADAGYPARHCRAEQRRRRDLFVPPHRPDSPTSSSATSAPPTA